MSDKTIAERALDESFESLVKNALRIKAERDALLEACKAIAALDDGDAMFVWQHEKEFKAVHAAIAKAEGVEEADHER